MASLYPQPEEIGIVIPKDIRQDRYKAGFEHALTGGQLNRVAYFRRSFRLGFRTAKLYLRALRQHQGVVSFPIQGRFRIRAG